VVPHRRSGRMLGRPANSKFAQQNVGNGATHLLR
jgi:hypothetical protein